MAQNIKLKRSSVSGKVPTVAQLEAGELAINTADGKLYFERDDSTIQSIVTTNALITGSVNINGPITGSDIRINQWGSVSASLSSIQSQGASVTLQDVTDNGNTTDNDIIITGSLTTTENLVVRGTTFGRSPITADTKSIAIGLNVLEATQVSAASNIAIGFEAQKDVTVGGVNIAIGQQALWRNQSGSANTAIGMESLNLLGSTGAAPEWNVGLGRFAGGNLQEGNHNIALGSNALIILQTGSYNTGVGSRSGTGFFKGNGNIFIGYEAGPEPSLGPQTFSNRLYINNTSSYTPLIYGEFDNEFIKINGELYVSENLKVTGSIATPTSITGSDVRINEWGSVSASLASIGNNTVSSSYAVSASHAELADLATNAINTSYAQNVTVIGKNLSAGTIAKGTPLYFTGSGTSGNLVGIYPADADNPARMPAGGIAGETITTGNEGLVLISGFINGVDTSAFNAGDQVYVAGGGGYTNTPPTGSALIQKLGNIEKVDASNGSGVINGPGAARSVPNIASGFTWVGDGNSVATPTAVSSLSVASAVSASYAATADAVGILNQDVTVNGNLTVFGTASFTSVTSSQLIVDDSFIAVNVFEPAERFGGLRVYDSGSLSHQATASLAWDSLHNHWVYQNASGSTYSGGMFLAGPRNTGSLGDEPTLTRWYIPRADGGDHLNDSQIYSSGSKTDITGSLTTTGKLTIGTVDNYGADPDKFLSIVNGEVVYRTGAQLLSDIGGQTAGTFVQNSGAGGTARYIMRYEDSNSATTSSMYEDASGRIGIKTTAPSYNLDINGQARVSTSSNVGAYVKTTSAFGAVISYQDSTTPASEFVTAGAYGKGFVIGTDSQVKVIVDSTGSIGVGTLTPVNAPDERGITISGIAGAGYYFDVSSETTSLKNNQGTIELNYSYGGVKFNAPGGTRMELASVGNLTLNRYGQGNFVTDTPVSLLAAGNNSGYVMEVTHLKFNSGTTTVSGSLIISGSTDVIQQGIKVTGTGSLTVTSISTTSYDGAFLDYLIVSGSNKRAGTLTTVWTASDIEWKDTSTLDLGSTDGAEFAPAINGSNADLVLSLPTGTWTVKGHLRYM